MLNPLSHLRISHQDLHGNHQQRYNAQRLTASKVIAPILSSPIGTFQFYA